MNRRNAEVDAGTLAGDPAAIQRVQAGNHHDPHNVLGAHPARSGGRDGTIIRAYHPDAKQVECLIDGSSATMQSLGGGIFALFVPDRQPPLSYRLRFSFDNGETWERDDPYRFQPSVGEMDLYLFGEGNHRRLWEALGARMCTLDGVEGVSFAVWAPNARRVSVVGDFNGWDGRLMPMRSLGSSGVFELFVPGVRIGELYKYELKTQEGALRVKTDPMAKAMELPPGTASCITASSFEWGDEAYLEARAQKDITREPVNVYECHLGSWMRVQEEGNRSLDYREIAPRLVDHVKRLGFTHIEFLPLAEHAFFASWGYQVTGYYAPSARYGNPDDLRYLIDYCHRHDIGVIMDWVPAHFPKDDFALRRFDGTALYEHDDPRRGEHPDWGTLIFNYGRPEVQNFLVANALYWLQEFHIDGLRVDAVASMLYLDYSRKEGEWMPNPYGGRENIEAIEFLRATNHIIGEEVPGAFTVAEESTSWPGVTRFGVDRGARLHVQMEHGLDARHALVLQPGSGAPQVPSGRADVLDAVRVYRAVHQRDFPRRGRAREALAARQDAGRPVAEVRQLAPAARLPVHAARQAARCSWGPSSAPWLEWNHDASLDWHLADSPDRKALDAYRAGARRHVPRALVPMARRPGRLRLPMDRLQRPGKLRDVLRATLRRRAGVVVLNLTPVPQGGLPHRRACSGALRRTALDRRRALRRQPVRDAADGRHRTHAHARAGAVVAAEAPAAGSARARPC